MDATGIIAGSLWGTWMILFIIHVLRLLGLDGFSEKSFKAGHARKVLTNYVIDREKLNIKIKENNMLQRDLSVKKCILISVQRKIFSFIPKDVFYKFRTVIDYSDPHNTTVTIYWDKHWILQFYIFIIWIPATILSACSHIVYTLLFIVTPYIPFYLLLHTGELRKVKQYEKKMIHILS